MAQIPWNRRYRGELRHEGQPVRSTVRPGRQGGRRVRSARRRLYLLLALVGLLGMGLLRGLMAPSDNAPSFAPPVAGETALPVPGMPRAQTASRVAVEAPTASAPSGSTTAWIWEVAVPRGARVRAGPDTSYPLLCALPPGVWVEALDRHVAGDGLDWLHVRVPPGLCQDSRGRRVGSGWIRGDLLRSRPIAGSIWEVAVPRGARVRAGPGTSYPSPCALAEGVLVQGLDRGTAVDGSDWLRVRFSEGLCRDTHGRLVQEGWIRADLLRLRP